MKIRNIFLMPLGFICLILLYIIYVAGMDLLGIIFGFMIVIAIPIWIVIGIYNLLKLIYEKYKEKQNKM